MYHRLFGLNSQPLQVRYIGILPDRPLSHLKVTFQTTQNKSKKGTPSPSGKRRASGFINGS
jgi:hypothetical protein